MIAKKTQKTHVIRVSGELYRFYKELGSGRIQHGLIEAKTIVNLVKRDPAKVLQLAFEEYANTIKAFCPDNHYQHFVDSMLPVIHNKFHKTGEVDARILSLRRPETPIDDFDDKKKEDVIDAS